MVHKRSRRAKLWDRRDGALTPRQRADKSKFLNALSPARRGIEILENALKQRGLDPKQVVKKTNAIKIRNGKLVAKVRDRIPRSMKIYEHGKLRHVEFANSKIASDIGHYWNAIGTLTETGKSRALRSLKRRRFKDINGHWHTLEKDPKVVLELEARAPKHEGFEIYWK
jgi:hypothetical protein